jgi:hypothetical protein
VGCNGILSKYKIKVNKIKVNNMTKNRIRNEEGSGWIPAYSNEVFVDAVGGIHDTTTAKDVAGVVKCGISLAQKRLKELAANGIIEGKKIGNTWMYWKIE